MVSRAPDWESFKITPNAGDGPVAFCADLSPDSVLSACQNGIFPFPAPDEYAREINEFRYEDQVSDGVISLVGDTDDDPYRVAWWSPDPRPVIKSWNIHLGRNVRKQLRRGHEQTTANDSFQRVAEECRAGREPRWFTDTLLESMVKLHKEGWAHSIEVWQDGDLIGGALGIGVGLVLSGDSMFSWVQVLCMLAFSLVATLAWTLLDRKQTQYARLYDALKVYVEIGLGLILIEYGGLKVVPSQFPRPSLSRRIVSTVAASGLDDERAESFFGPGRRDRRVVDDYVVASASFRPQLLIDAAGAIPQFDRPVLLIWGESCDFFPMTDARRLASDFTRATLVSVPGAKTWVPVDNPVAVADAIVKFVPTPVP